MNETETIMFQKYKDMGYDVIHHGIPDFVLLKDHEIKFREIKGRCPNLSDSQKQAIKLLQEHGFDVKVDTVVFPKLPDFSNKNFERLSPEKNPLDVYWHNLEIYEKMLSFEPVYPKVL